MGKPSILNDNGIINSNMDDNQMEKPLISNDNWMANSVNIK